MYKSALTELLNKSPIKNTYTQPHPINSDPHPDDTQLKPHAEVKNTCIFDYYLADKYNEIILNIKNNIKRKYSNAINTGACDKYTKYLIKSYIPILCDVLWIDGDFVITDKTYNNYISNDNLFNLTVTIVQTYEIYLRLVYKVDNLNYFYYILIGTATDLDVCNSARRFIKSELKKTKYLRILLN